MSVLHPPPRLPHENCSVAEGELYIAMLAKCSGGMVEEGGGSGKQHGPGWALGLELSGVYKSGITSWGRCALYSKRGVFFGTMLLSVIDCERTWELGASGGFNCTLCAMGLVPRLGIHFQSVCVICRLYTATRGPKGWQRLAAARRQRQLFTRPHSCPGSK